MCVTIEHRVQWMLSLKLETTLITLLLSQLEVSSILGFSSATLTLKL
jgi:hypothetical protein